MSTSRTAPRTAVACTHPSASAVPRCEGCGLTAKAMVHRVSRSYPDRRLQASWTVREVWSALAAAEADLETQWLLPETQSWLRLWRAVTGT